MSGCVTVTLLRRGRFPVIDPLQPLLLRLVVEATAGAFVCTGGFLFQRQRVPLVIRLEKKSSRGKVSRPNRQHKTRAVKNSPTLCAVACVAGSAFNVQINFP